MLIILNWKSYIEDKASATRLYKKSADLARRSKHTLVACVPAVFLGLFGGSKSKLAVGVQDISDAESGAHTGENTAGMARSLGASYAIIGHSEKRASGDTDAIVVQKVVRALAKGLVPVVCVGEETRDEKLHYLDTLREQVSLVLSGVPEIKRKSIIFAYEPLWAINHGDHAITAEDLYETITYIRKIVMEHTSDVIAKKVKILYGGSVEVSNVAYLAKDGGVNGFLVGHASVDSKKLTALMGALK